jgi:hypothetical protein
MNEMRGRAQFRGKGFAHEPLDQKVEQAIKVREV